MRCKVSSDWLPSYFKATRPVLEIFKVAGFFPDRPCTLPRILSSNNGNIFCLFNAYHTHFCILLTCAVILRTKTKYPLHVSLTWQISPARWISHFEPIKRKLHFALYILQNKIQNDHIQHKNKINGNVRVNIVINNNIIEHVTDFKYLGVPYIRIQKWFRRQIANIQQNKRSYTETFWKTNEQRNKIKNSQHYS